MHGAGARRFGTFGGVFTPAFLGILGLIMFLRSGYIVGAGGLHWALLMLLLALCICLATGLSISTISTNTPVGVGGIYFLISRSLGAGFGSAIGLTLFLAKSLLIPLHILGFCEVLAKEIPVLAERYLALNLCAALLVTALVFVGAEWVIKCQYAILAILTVSTVCMLGGLALHYEGTYLQMNWTHVENASFFQLFAIFFPAVTGILMGVGMSGDLKDPAKSIPLGVLAAIVVAFGVYLLQFILLSGASYRSALIETPFLFLTRHALPGMAVMLLAGVLAATLSSALGSLLGAPRVLQAIGRDGLLRALAPFGKGSGPSDEPRRALLVSGAITFLVLAWAAKDGLKGGGEEALNSIAEAVSMCILYAFAMVNLAAFVESFGGNPSFRPRFRFFHWSFALAAALACLGVSLFINPLASLGSLAVILILYWISSRKAMQIAFGDARRGFVFSIVRWGLLTLRSMPKDPKNWRPSILVLSSDPRCVGAPISLASLFEFGRGVVSVAHFAEAPDEGVEADTLRKTFEESLAEEHPEALPILITCESFPRALAVFLQAQANSPMKANLIMLGWPNTEAAAKLAGENMLRAMALDISCVLVANHKEQQWAEPYPGQPIDVWWRGKSNGGLMIMLAWMLSRNPGWAKGRLRILRAIKDMSSTDDAHNELETLAAKARIDAEIRVVPSNDDFFKTLIAESSGSAAVFIGFHQEHCGEELYKRFDAPLKSLPLCLLVCAAEPLDPTV